MTPNASRRTGPVGPLHLPGWRVHLTDAQHERLARMSGQERFAYLEGRVDEAELPTEEAAA